MTFVHSSSLVKQSVTLGRKGSSILQNVGKSFVERQGVTTVKSGVLSSAAERTRGLAFRQCPVSHWAWGSVVVKALRY